MTVRTMVDWPVEMILRIQHYSEGSARDGV